MPGPTPNAVSLPVLILLLGWVAQASATNDAFGSQPLSAALAGGTEGARISNPSFELDTFDVFPGYITQNGVVTGWDALGNSGLNPISDGQSPFADNGVIQSGNQVGFLQSNPSGESRLSTLMTGLVAGSTYRVEFRTNARSNSSAVRIQVWVSGEVVETSLNGNPPALFQDITPVGGSNPYHRVSFLFTAVTPNQALTIVNAQGGDNTVLVDDFRLTDWNRLFGDRFNLETDRLGFENLEGQLLSPGTIYVDGPFLIQAVIGNQWDVTMKGNPGNALTVGRAAVPDIGDTLSIRLVDGGAFQLDSLDYRSLTTAPSDSLEIVGLNDGQIVSSISGVSAPDNVWRTLQPVFEEAVDEVLLRVESIGAFFILLDNIVLVPVRD